MRNKGQNWEDLYKYNHLRVFGEITKFHTAFVVKANGTRDNPAVKVF